MGPEQGISNLNAMLAALSFWQPNTAIGLGAIARSHSVITNGTFYAECITAGTTGASEPAWPAVGQTVTDGTVTWIIRDKSQANNFAQQPDLSAIATKVPTIGFIKDWMQSIKNSDQTIWDGKNWSYPPLGAHGLSDSNGYVVIDKLGHLCLQWGFADLPHGYAAVAHFAIAFSSVSYIPLAIGSISSGDNNLNDTINFINDYNKTKTSCVFRVNNESAPAVIYAVIGFV